MRDGEPCIGTGRGRCGDPEVQNSLSVNEQGQTAPVSAADICECSMETLKLSQEFLGTHNVHIREMFYII